MLFFFVLFSIDDTKSIKLALDFFFSVVLFFFFYVDVFSNLVNTG